MRGWRRSEPDRPRIGVFDSGIGGLTVVRALIERVPGAELIYLGDTARTPYGNKSADTVRAWSFENAAFLLEKGIDVLVVACNTASAVALEALAENLPVPVVGVIEPGAKAAVARTRCGRIGVIATESTIASGAYVRVLRRLCPELEIYTRACPLFVPLAEEGWTDDDVALAVAARYLGSLRQSGIDTLILGCTHYPLLGPAISAVMGPEVTLVDSATATAEAVAALPGLERAAQAGPPSVGFFVTDAPERFIRVGSRFLGTAVESAVCLERRPFGLRERRRGGMDEAGTGPTATKSSG